MEQNADAGAPMTPVVDSKQKSGNGLEIATAIACIVAVCGIGFGVYGMAQISNKDSQISDLKNQINILSLESDNNNAMDEIAGNSNTTVDNDSKDYIYIGEWGIKIKIPDGLKYIDYSFENSISDGNNEYPEDYSTILFNGIASSSDKTSAKEFLRQARVNRCYTAWISRTPKSTFDIRGQLIFEDENYNYSYMHSQAACSDGKVGSTDVESEGNSLIINMLTDSSNYSRIQH